MRRELFLLLFLASLPLFSQEKYPGKTETAATDTVPESRKNSPMSQKTGKSGVEPTQERDVRPVGKSSGSRSETQDTLNQMFNPGGSTTMLCVKNRSKCPIDVDIRGEKAYRMKVPEDSRDCVLVEKGSYAISTNICGAKYASVKDVQENTVLSLSAD